MLYMRSLTLALTNTLNRHWDISPSLIETLSRSVSLNSTIRLGGMIGDFVFMPRALDPRNSASAIPYRTL